MDHRIGDAFHAEIAAAGVIGLDQWRADGVLVFADGSRLLADGTWADADGSAMPPGVELGPDKLKARAVLTAHDPATPSPPKPPAPYSVDQAAVVHRMTDPELARFEAGLALPAAIRVRLLWAGERTIRSDGPFFALLQPVFAAAYGDARAAELLAAPAA